MTDELKNAYSLIAEEKKQRVANFKKEVEELCVKYSIDIQDMKIIAGDLRTSGYADSDIE